jgi:hypothetical protein
MNGKSPEFAMQAVSNRAVGSAVSFNVVSVQFETGSVI